MMLRGRSKDRERKTTPPGPVYMSNEEFAEYLKNLRNNRIARPGYTKTEPSNSRPDHDDRDHPSAVPVSSRNSAGSSPLDLPPRSTSAVSHRRAYSSLTNSYSSMASHPGRQLVKPPSQDPQVPLLKPSEVVASATYIERGQRWMEKEEAVSLREAMEDMNLKEELEEQRIYAAAQNEASELVWQYEYPDSVVRPDQPYRYNQHLKKNSYQYARSQSVGRNGASKLTTGLARDIPMPSRSVSGGSNSSEGLNSNRGRVSNEVSGPTKRNRNHSADSQTHISLKSTKKRQDRISKDTTSGDITHGCIAFGSQPLRRRTSTRRNISGEIVTGRFNGHQIWEEQEEPILERRSLQTGRNILAPLRTKSKNPLNRVQFVSELELCSKSTAEPTKKLSACEIHKNPPSQSRNPLYTANPPPALITSQGTNHAQLPHKLTKDGLEIRSDEIRQATSMRLKDRSPKLPTPTIVSDRPGRPIVSFDLNWKPKQADVKPEVRKSPFDRSKLKKIQHPRSAPAISSTTASTSIASNRYSQPKVNAHRPTSVNPGRKNNGPVPPIPSINLPDSTSIPIINTPDATSILIITPDSSAITVEAPKLESRRPLPVPKSATCRSITSNSVISKGHWTPVAGKRATATCHQCQLPIEGRVLKINSSTEHFHPECFKCFTCGTELESLEIHPEPSSKRMERIDRIRRRAQVESIPEIEGQMIGEDGDERQRYYCHLDFHENFAPRCKHCKTPIIGEHLVALGEHWHHGHFFCAECGDPFEKGMTHIEKDGYAWCLSCQTRRTENQAPKCKKCKESVVGEYVQALGQEWHERCFRCAVCSGGFDDGAFYPKEVEHGQIVLCIRCIERELKA